MGSERPGSLATWEACSELAWNSEQASPGGRRWGRGASAGRGRLSAWGFSFAANSGVPWRLRPCGPAPMGGGPMTSGLGAPTGWRRGRRSRDSCPFHFFYLNPTFLHLHVQSPPVQRGTPTGHRDKDREGPRTLAGLPGAALSSRHRDARQEQLTADSPSHECDRHLGAAQWRAGSLAPRDKGQKPGLERRPQ